MNQSVEHEQPATVDVCPICFDALSSDVTLLNCSHKYHKECIEKWISATNSCAVCRKPADATKPVKKLDVDSMTEDERVALEMQLEEIRNDMAHQMMSTLLSLPLFDQEDSISGRIFNRRRQRDDFDMQQIRRNITMDGRDAIARRMYVASRQQMESEASQVEEKKQPLNIKRCDACDEILERPMICQCRKVRYCGRDCQKADWIFHKEDCIPLSERRRKSDSSKS